MQWILASPCHPVSWPGRRAPHSHCSQRCPRLSPGCVTWDPWAPGHRSHPLPSASPRPRGLCSLLAGLTPHLPRPPPLCLVGREDLSSGSHRDSGLASISAESQQQRARHFLLGHNLETKEVGRDKGGRGWSSTPVGSYFCTHWIPTIPWVPAAFLLMPESSTGHLCAISWAILSPACGVHTSCS